MATKTKEKIEIINAESTGFKNEGVVVSEQPYIIDVEIKGTETILLHRYDCEAVEAKGKAKKGSKEKKTDNLESYVYRNESGELCFPGLNIKACMADAAKYFQDPRSPRKALRDLLKAGLKVPGMPSFGKRDWELLDKRRAVVQRNGVTRVRPGMLTGWELKFQIDVVLPEYFGESLVHEVLERAGRTVGLGDFRPDFGTFRITSFERRVLK